MCQEPLVGGQHRPLCALPSDPLALGANFKMGINSLGRALLGCEVRYREHIEHIGPERNSPSPARMHSDSPASRGSVQPLSHQNPHPSTLPPPSAAAPLPPLPRTGDGSTPPSSPYCSRLLQSGAPQRHSIDGNASCSPVATFQL